MIDQEQRRMECEARYWLAIPLSARRVHLENIERRRGKPAADRLKEEMARQWSARQGAAA